MLDRKEIGKRNMRFFRNVLQGIILGAAAIIPGFSGGVLAVMMGIYDKLTEILSNPFRNFKKNVIFLLPLGVGAAIGILFFAHLIQFLFQKYFISVMYTFIGLVGGGIPFVFQKANEQGFRKSYILLFIISFSVILLLKFLEGMIPEVTWKKENLDFPMLFFYGVILGFGSIIPGLTTSFLLIYFGVFDSLIQAVTMLNLKLLLPVGGGFIFCILLTANLIHFLFRRFYGAMYYIVLGLAIGSLLLVFPGFPTYLMEWITGVVLLASSFFFTLFTMKHEPENETTF